MKRLGMMLVPAVLLASPAMAQHHHGSHAPEVKPEPKKAVDPHAGHVMPQADPHAGHHMPQAASQPAATTGQMDHSAHAGHAMPQADPHAGHVMLPKTAPAMVTSGPKHAADLYFDAADMARARQFLRHENGDMRFTAFKIDRLEGRFAEGEQAYGWEVEGFSGGDINRFWWKSDGEGAFDGGLHEASVQALYSRAVAPFWDVQAGVKQDYQSHGPDRTHLTLGVQGAAPYWFELSGAAYLSTKGDLTASMEAEYDLRLTQKWILQPVAHLALSAQDVPELELGAGVTSLSAGLLLRYEIKRELAPYVGVEWEGVVGNTADLIRARGGEVDQTRFVVGLKAWF